MANKTKYIGVKLSESEHEKLLKIVASKGLTISAYFRKKIQLDELELLKNNKG